jgi:hypothetical protein
MEEYQWEFTFANIGALVTNYTNVEIRGVATSIPGFLGTCAFSCSDGSQKKIQIDSTGSVFSPQSRILHESGHVVNYLMKPYHLGFFNYCYPNTVAPDGVGGATPCQWSGPSTNDAEWADVAFEEGYATFSADNSLWAPNSVNPTSCISQVACADNSNTDIEQSDYPFCH